MPDVIAPAAGRQRSLGLITVVIAVAGGLAVANVNYAQPLLDLMARSFHTSQGAATIVVTITQIGYALGLFLVLPLGDLIENRALTSRILVVTAVALALAGAAPQLGVFLAASVIVGLTSVVAQILIPLAAHLASDAHRGRIVGRVQSGLMLGIMLARSVASLVADAWGWRAIYFLSAGLMLLASVLLAAVLPRRRPDHRAGYGSLLASVARLARTEPALRRRAVGQALIFVAFTAFWTAVAYELIDNHGYSQAGVGLFALVGAVGVCVAPLAGRLADRGYGTSGTGAAMLLGVGAMVLAGLGRSSVVLLGVAAVLLDLAATAHQLFSQREIYDLAPHARARVNTVFMGTVFIGGAIGSAVAGALHDSAGWTGVSVFGAVAFGIGFLLWLGSRLLSRQRSCGARASWPPRSDRP